MRMRKYLSVFLCLEMLLSLSSVALATDSSEHRTDAGIVGTVIFQENGPTDLGTNRNDDTSTVTVSYKDNGNYSYTVYQYNDDILIEEHTTTLGSGIVDHKFYQSDGSFITEREFTRENPESGISPLVNNDPYSNLSSAATTRSLGYMHYRNYSIEEILSINCYVIEEMHINQPYTFYKDAAKKLADWVTVLLSIWAFRHKAPELLVKVINGLGAYGLLNGPITGIMTVAFTKTVRCTYYNQEIHGNPTQPMGRGKHARLDGTYCFVDVLGSTEVMAEGYTVRDWGDGNMGRQMMYQVFGLEVVPTSWSNTDI